MYYIVLYIMSTIFSVGASSESSSLGHTTKEIPSYASTTDNRLKTAELQKTDNISGGLARRLNRRIAPKI